MKKKNYKGDGLSFYNSVATFAGTNEEIQEKMNISNGTFYRLYQKEIFDDDEKFAVAKALGKNVEDIFASIYKKESANSTVLNSVDDSNNNNKFVPHIEREYPYDLEKDSINESYFERIMPGGADMKGWIPFFSSFSTLVNQYKNADTYLLERENPNWIMRANPTEVIYFKEFKGDISIQINATNMPVSVPRGAMAMLHYMPNKRVRPGNIYMVLFDDMDYGIYKINLSDNTEKLWLEGEEIAPFEWEINNIVDIWRITNVSMAI